jgi:hypothetical protein
MATSRIDVAKPAPPGSRSGRTSSSPSRGENEISIDALEPVSPQQGLPPDSSPGASANATSGESREQRISRAAYGHAERRGFEPGGELEDWLMAERDIDSDAKG